MLHQIPVENRFRTAWALSGGNSSYRFLVRYRTITDVRASAARISDGQVSGSQVRRILSKATDRFGHFAGLTFAAAPAVIAFMQYLEQAD
jgi:hypothetical protein